MLFSLVEASALLLCVRYEIVCHQFCLLINPAIQSNPNISQSVKNP